MAGLRGRLLGIVSRAVRRSLLRTFVVCTCIALIITVWAARRQLIVGLARGDGFMVWGLLPTVLLLVFIVVLSAFRAIVAGTVVASVVAVGEKLLVNRAVKLRRTAGKKPPNRGNRPE